MLNFYKQRSGLLILTITFKFLMEDRGYRKEGGGMRDFFAGLLGLLVGITLVLISITLGYLAATH